MTAPATPNGVVATRSEKMTEEKTTQKKKYSTKHTTPDATALSFDGAWSWLVCSSSTTRDASIIA